MTRALAIACALACALAACKQAAPPEDGEWTTADWVKVGLPDPSREWSTDQLTIAVGMLSDVSVQHPGALPVFQSARSGDVFARVIAPVRIDAKGADGLVGQLMPREEALRKLMRVYQQTSPAVPRRELLELTGALLDNYVLLMPSLLELMKSFPPTDPSYQVRQGGLDKVKTGLGMMLNGSLTMAGSEALSIESRHAVFAYLTRDVAALAPLLGGADRQTFRALLAKDVASSSQEIAHDALALQRVLPLELGSDAAGSAAGSAAN